MWLNIFTTHASDLHRHTIYPSQSSHVNYKASRHSHLETIYMQHLFWMVAWNLHYSCVFNQDGHFVSTSCSIYSLNYLLAACKAHKLIFLMISILNYMHPFSVVPAWSIRSTKVVTLLSCRGRCYKCTEAITVWGLGWCKQTEINFTEVTSG
jgi:hypothetical protein